MNSWQNATPSTSSTAAATPDLNSLEFGCSVSPHKVSEVFMTAGQAFQKLGTLIANLQNPSKNGNDRKWTDSDTSSLHDAVTRFASDLQRISEQVQEREVHLMKDDITRRATLGHYIRTTSSPSQRVAPSGTKFASVSRPLVKRTVTTGQPLVDVGVKRRIVVTSAPSGITVLGTPHYVSGTPVQAQNTNLTNVQGWKNGPVSTEPSTSAAVTVNSTTLASAVLPERPVTAADKGGSVIQMVLERVKEEEKDIDSQT